uniref:SWIM-type domain-containing protein n=1 Tax=Lactuca sativa TaxID=4236 RepID=A0A9R1WLU2_LACSA|nr:hypothetical protein LSAT_V11C100038120 [Lactuca sativa]
MEMLMMKSLERKVILIMKLKMTRMRLIKIQPNLGFHDPFHLLYANQIELRFCLTNYVVHNGYPIKASWMNKEKSFQIKGLTNKHTCVREYKHATLGQCYRAKKKALKILTRKLSEHYARIWQYGGEIIRSNPGSTAKVGFDIKEDGSSVFKRLYAIKDGWIRGCRRVIGLDGELPTTIGRDGNNHVYLIDWVVIDVENKDNWEWFINLLVEDLSLELGEGLTIISDQHKVDFGEKFYTCRLWEIYGIACVHACATMTHTQQQQQPETRISSWFFKEKFVETYKRNMRDLNGSKMWARTPYAKPLPPPARRMPGRPKTRRRKHVREGWRVQEDKVCWRNKDMPELLGGCNTHPQKHNSFTGVYNQTGAFPHS